jgi:hypothetical protein
VVAGMWLCRFRNRQVKILNNIIHPRFQELHYLCCSCILSINFVIFIQAAVIPENGPGGNRHVAVPVLEPAGKIFKQYHPPEIPRITLFMLFQHSLY